MKRTRTDWSAEVPRHEIRHERDIAAAGVDLGRVIAEAAEDMRRQPMNDAVRALSDQFWKVANPLIWYEFSQTCERTEEGYKITITATPYVGPRITASGDD